MQQIVLKLYNEFQRPMFNIHDDKLIALMDTGALYPVWTKSEEMLVKLLNAKHIKGNIPISGFGGIAYENMYEIPILKVGTLIYPSIHIVAATNLRNTPFHIILSATMFSRLSYEIDNIHSKFKITILDNESTVRNYKLIDSKGNIHIMCQSNFKALQANLVRNHIAESQDNN